MRLTKEQTRIREELNTQGWALVDTTKYVKEGFLVKNFTVSRNGPCDLTFVVSDYQYSSQIPENLKPYKEFIRRTIEKCLYDEALRFTNFDLRYYKDPSKNIGEWHTDGGAIRVIAAIKGQSTEFRPSRRSKKVLNIPQGWSLIFSGDERVKIKKSIPHRMPAHSGRRKMLVITFMSNLNPKDKYLIVERI